VKSESNRSTLLLLVYFGVTRLLTLGYIIIQGINGYSMEHEWTLYVFDTVPMFVVAVVFWIWFPGQIRPAVDEYESVELGENGIPKRP